MRAVHKVDICQGILLVGMNNDTSLSHEVGLYITRVSSQREAQRGAKGSAQQAAKNRPTH